MDYYQILFSSDYILPLTFIVTCFFVGFAVWYAVLKQDLTKIISVLKEINKLRNQLKDFSPMSVWVSKLSKYKNKDFLLEDINFLSISVDSLKSQADRCFYSSDDLNKICRLFSVLRVAVATYVDNDWNKRNYLREKLIRDNLNNLIISLNSKDEFLIQRKNIIENNILFKFLDSTKYITTIIYLVLLVVNLYIKFG